MTRIKALVQRLQASLPLRAWQRYGQARGGVLAGGMAYVAFFSLIPALAVGFTIFKLVLGGNVALQARVVKAVNDGLGTTIITPRGGSGGVVSIDALTSSGTATNIVGLIGLIGFLLTALGWLDAMREGVRAMFGQPTLQGNVVVTKARDLLVLTTIGVVLLASAIGGVVINSATGGVLKLIGLSDSVPGQIVVRATATLVVLAVDVVVFVVIFILLSGVSVPRSDLWDAALFGGIGLGILKQLSGVLLKSASHNAFLASAGVFLGLLVWLNLVSRLTLVAAAWGATVALDRGHLLAENMDLPMQTVAVPDGAAGAPGSAVPALAAMARSATTPAGAGRPAPAAAFTPVISPRGADRISVAAGALLGAAGVLAVRTAAGAVRTLIAPLSREQD